MARSAAKSGRPEGAEGVGLWKNRPFLALWMGNTISVVGDGFHSVALGLWVLRTTGSGTALAVVMALRIVTGVLLGTLAGVVGDRVDRRRLMVLMNLARCGLVAVMAILLNSSGTPISAIFLFTFLVSLATTWYLPAAQASLVQIVGKEKVGRANGLLQTTGALAQVAGPLLGGVVVTAFSGGIAMAVDAASFLVSAIVLILGGAFPITLQSYHGDGSFLSDLRAGLVLVRKESIVLAMALGLPILNVFAGAAIVLMPIIAIRDWRVTQLEYSAIEALFMLGTVAGALWAFGVSKAVNRGPWLSFGLISTPLFGLLSIASPAFGLASFGIFIAGTFNSLAAVLIYTVLQEKVAPDLQGRVFGVLGSAVSLVNPISMVGAGALADVFDPKLVGVSVCVLYTASAIVLVLVFPDLRKAI